MARSRWSEGLFRGSVLGVVAGAHLLALIAALVPAWFVPTHGREIQRSDDALQVHFLPPPWRQPSSRPTVSPAPVPMARPRVRHRDHSPHPVPTPGAAAALNLALPPQASGDHAGGADFHRRLENAKRALPVVRLPGTGGPLVAGLHFADPKTQGAAGIARGLQHLLGLPNKHCIDVDVWRNMTREELLKRHISDRDVERVAAENGCL